MAESIDPVKHTDDKVVKAIANLIGALPGEERRKLIENLKDMAIFGGCTIHTCSNRQHKHI